MCLVLDNFCKGLFGDVPWLEKDVSLELVWGFVLYCLGLRSLVAGQMRLRLRSFHTDLWPLRSCKRKFVKILGVLSPLHCICDHLHLYHMSVVQAARWSRSKVRGAL